MLGSTGALSGGGAAACAHPRQLAKHTLAASLWRRGDARSVRLRAEPIGLELPLQRAAVDAEGGRGARDVAVHLAEHALDVRALDVRQARALAALQLGARREADAQLVQAPAVALPA